LGKYLLKGVTIVRPLLLAGMIALAALLTAGLVMAEGDCSKKSTQTTTVDSPQPATVASSK